ncbi:hypothetical protein GCM10011348_28860 [Marinobacterium nitratireducens]|uniref:Heme-binding protein n=1 Tax=Marinobacterium nitratireducens TaxID=518897 RepID=A0A917ZIS6_9GAMM|nr:heme-binding protein [Marinobacterium nitratireducens]GGO83889.1 hypothetical protein GCM10011348_28860 [Marinobacterium nitratireducens]
MNSFVTHYFIKSELAGKLAQAAIEHARSTNIEICATVCDPAGHPVALLRTDRVRPPAIGFAIDKAYTAATLHTSTQAFHERAASRPALAMGLANRERILVFPGGLPIYGDGQLIGGIGVSGATETEDVECARAALAALGLAESPQGT